MLLMGCDGLWLVSIYLSICLFVCLSVYLSIYPSIHLSIYLFIYLFILLLLCDNHNKIGFGGFVGLALVGGLIDSFVGQGVVHCDVCVALMFHVPWFCYVWFTVFSNLIPSFGCDIAGQDFPNNDDQSDECSACPTHRSW